MCDLLVSNLCSFKWVKLHRYALEHYALNRSPTFAHTLTTHRLDVPYYVKSIDTFEVGAAQVLFVQVQAVQVRKCCPGVVLLQKNVLWCSMESAELANGCTSST
jgi:hypothetical protein